MTDFDEKTGIRSRSLRHELITRLISELGITICHKDLVSFVSDVHEKLGLGLCSLSPDTTVDNLDFGYCRPLYASLGTWPAGNRNNTVCTDPVFFVGPRGQHQETVLLTADKFDSWCLGVILACRQGIEPFRSAAKLQPLNCLRHLQKHIAELRCDFDGLLCLDPKERTSIQKLYSPKKHFLDPRCQLRELCGSDVQDFRDIPTTIHQLLKRLTSRTSASSPGLGISQAVELLSGKLDLLIDVHSSDKHAARTLSSLCPDDQARVLDLEKELLCELLDLLVPQLCVSLC
jgi:hypothetical protein